MHVIDGSHHVEPIAHGGAAVSWSRCSLEKKKKEIRFGLEANVH
jgi:hypothetical protein